MHWTLAPDSKMEFSPVPLSEASSYRSFPAAWTLPTTPALYGECRWSELLDRGDRLDSRGDKYEPWDSARGAPPSELPKRPLRESAQPGRGLQTTEDAQSLSRSPRSSGPLLIPGA